MGKAELKGDSLLVEGSPNIKKKLLLSLSPTTNNDQSRIKDKSYDGPEREYISLPRQQTLLIG